MLNMESTENRT